MAANMIPFRFVFAAADTVVSAVFTPVGREKRDTSSKLPRFIRRTPRVLVPPAVRCAHGVSLALSRRFGDFRCALLGTVEVCSPTLLSRAAAKPRSRDDSTFRAPCCCFVTRGEKLPQLPRCGTRRQPPIPPSRTPDTARPAAPSPGAPRQRPGRPPGPPR